MRLTSLADRQVVRVAKSGVVAKFGQLQATAGALCSNEAASVGDVGFVGGFKKKFNK